MNSSRTYGAGFTLLELLMVIVMIAILAALAVPNFLEAQLRSKIAHTVQSQQFVALALESYFADNGKYPEVPPLIKSKDQPVCEEVLIPLNIPKKEWGGNIPSGLTQKPEEVGVPPELIAEFMFEEGSETYFVPPPEAGAKSAPKRPRERFPELQVSDRISTATAKELQEKIKTINSWAEYFCYLDELRQYLIITPETVKSEFSNIDVSEEGKQSLLNRRDELFRLSVFAYRDDIYRAQQLPEYVFKTKVINQNMYSYALYALTTPVAYIATEYLKDRFIWRKMSSYCYLNFTQVNKKGLHINSAGQTMLYAIISAGPDTKIDFLNTLQP
ncbi:prepilin-type N-terminal cleavage/methylation domain-containing protein, partial [Candidatus Sumerlaeota bacterium]|nr:prepilin-type N-terminal cleavage/methylation domain-containing protein [Candidatus Sumerlaeota bacterium]